jgi:hypothetical protein
MNCHQGGDTRVLQPGKDYTDFRPGTWLNDTLAIFRLASTGSDADLLEHHSAMQASRCFAGSGGKLSCFTCHDPHTRPAASEAAAWYRSKCLTCHTEASCTVPRASRAARNDDCIACHMPKRDVGTITHSALTNHRIVKVEGEPFTPAPRESTNGLILLNRPPAGDTLPHVTLLTAYGELMERDPSLQPRYLELLDQLAKQAPGNGLVQAALGARDLRTGSPGTAADHLSKALDLGFHSESAYADLSEALAQSGKLEDSIAVLKRGIEAEPYAARLYKFLALRYITLKQYPLAKEAMRKYVELFPEDDFMRGLLARVSR